VDLAARIADTDALTALDAAYAAAWDATDDATLAICRDRVAMLLRHQPTLDAMADDDRAALAAWTTSERFSDRDRAALAFTEQYIIDVTSLTDAQAGELRTHIGDDGLVNFVNALLVVEQRMTLELAFDGVL
jgi:alkylhydroperoxidase family enzyme